MATSTKTEPKLATRSGVFSSGGAIANGAISVPALLLTEGTFTDGNGIGFSITAADLDQVQANTEAWIAAGNDVHLFLSPHDFDGHYSDEKIGGQLEAGLYVETISNANLPDPRLQDLLGLKGLFGTIRIVAPSAVESYQARKAAGTRTRISVGLINQEGTEGYTCYEVSCVPWGAVPGAMLFGQRRAALTIGGAQAEVEANYWDSPESDVITDAMGMLYEVMRSIHTATAEELYGRDRTQLKEQAIADFVTMLRTKLGLVSEPPPSVTALGDPTMTTEPVKATTETAPDLQDLLTRLEALEAKNEALTDQNQALSQQLAEVQTRQAVMAQVGQLRDRAQGLVQAGQLTPHKFGELFPEGESSEDRVVRFLAPVEGKTYSGENGLRRLETLLDVMAENVPIPTGSVVRATTPIGTNPYRDTTQEEDEEAKEYARRLRERNPLKRAY